MKQIFRLFLFLVSALALAQEATPFYEVQFLKISSENNLWKTVRAHVDVNGKINNGKKKIGQLRNLSEFTKSITALIATADNVVKVAGDNEYRSPGIQDPHGRQNIYISVVLRGDFGKEEGLKNRTCYRYRETNLEPKKTHYAFYKYFSEADSALLKKLLR